MINNEELNTDPATYINIKYGLVPVGNQFPMGIKLIDNKFNIMFVPKSRMATEALNYKLVIMFEDQTKVFDLTLAVLKRVDEQLLQFEARARETAENEIAIMNPDL